MDINDDNTNDYYIEHPKEDIETGIFRRKISHLNVDSNERIKKNLKPINNYIFFIYIFTVVVLFTFVIKNIFYEDNYNNFQRLQYLKYKLNNNSKYNISHDLDLHLHLNNNKNHEKSDLNENFYYINKIE